MERKYSSNEEALSVAKEVIWLAWKAAGGPQGAGIFQDRGEQPKDKVWDQAYNQRDYSMRHGAPEEVSADYVFGRMLKLNFKVKNGVISHHDYEPRRDYQSWCGQYPTFSSLFDAAENAVKTQQAA